MKNIIKQSLIYRILAASAEWLDSQWQKSRLAHALQGTGESRESLIGRAAHAVHMALCALFHALRLDRLTEGSVFTRELFWMGLAVFLAPILPTMAVLPLALLGMGSVTVNFARNRERRAVRTPVKKWIAAYTLVYTVSGAFTLVRNGNVKATLMTLVFTFFAFAVIDAYRDLREIKRLISLMVAAGAIVAAYGIWQVLIGIQGSAKWIDERLFSNISTRVFSTLDNPNILSEYLLLILPLGVASTLNARTPNGKVAAALATGAMVLCMFLTWSRAGWIGLLLSMAVFLVLLDRRFVLPGLAGIVLIIAVLPQGMLDRLLSVGSTADSSAFYRFSIWTGTLRMLRDCWFSGVGPGAFSLIYPQYSLNAAIATHAHNLYFQIMCDSGVLGIVSFLGIVGSGVRCAAGALSRGPGRERRLYLIAVLSGLAGFLLQGIAEYSFYNYRVMLMFFVVIGLAAALSGRDMEDSQ